MRRCIEGWGWGIGGLKRRWGLVGQLHRASAQCRMSQRAPPQLLVAPNAAQLLISIQSKILNKLQFNSVHRVARKGVQAVSFFVHQVDRCQLHQVQRVLTVVATRGGYEPAAPIEAADNKRPGHIGCTAPPGQAACTRKAGWVQDPRFCDKTLKAPVRRVCTRKAQVIWTKQCEMHYFSKYLDHTLQIFLQAKLFLV